MADYIKRGTCGACKEFEFEGNNKKGYCRRYGAYYWDDDSCSRYDEDDERLSNGGSTCFLTTACCQHRHLPDDCHELTTLRSFRDTYLNESEDGKNLVKEYYRIAPAIVSKIMVHPQKNEILDTIYSEVCRIVALIEAHEDDDAVEAYQKMVLDVQSRLS